jgi:hypothetical protein
MRKWERKNSHTPSALPYANNPASRTLYLAPCNPHPATRLPASQLYSLPTFSPSVFPLSTSASLAAAQSRPSETTTGPTSEFNYPPAPCPMPKSQRPRTPHRAPRNSYPATRTPQPASQPSSLLASQPPRFPAVLALHILQLLFDSNRQTQ